MQENGQLGSTESRHEDTQTPNVVTDPHAAYSLMREESPACPMRALDGSPLWVVGRYDDVRALLEDGRFANNPSSIELDERPNMQVDALRELGVAENLIPYIADTLLDADGEDHKRLRRLVTPAFSARRIRALRPRIEKLVDSLMSNMDIEAKEGSVDFLEHFAYPLPITTICELVGIPREDQESWLDWTRALSFEQHRLGEILEPLVTYTHRLVSIRRLTPGDDLISNLIGAAKDEKLTDQELVTMVLSIVIAGHDTTANFLANSMWALLSNPHQIRLLQQRPRLLPDAVQELLRWCGPVLVSRVRYATTDIDAGWSTFRAGDPVMAALSAGNHDPRRFTDPDKLDIERKTERNREAHLSFGGGPHYCLGGMLARLEVEVALEQIIERWPKVELAVPSEQLRWQPVSGMRKLESLPLRIN